MHYATVLSTGVGVLDDQGASRSISFTYECVLRALRARVGDPRCGMNRERQWMARYRTVLIVNHTHCVTADRTATGLRRVRKAVCYCYCISRTTRVQIEL